MLVVNSLGKNTFLIFFSKFPVFSLSGKMDFQIPCFPCAVATPIICSFCYYNIHLYFLYHFLVIRTLRKVSKNIYPMNENASNSAGSKGNSRRRLVRNNAVSVSENNQFLLYRKNLFYCTEKISLLSFTILKMKSINLKMNFIYLHL